MNKPLSEQPPVDNTVGANDSNDVKDVDTCAVQPQPGAADLSGVLTAAEAPGEIGRFGHYRVGHNGFGLKGEIAVNQRYLISRPAWQVLGTILQLVVVDPAGETPV